MREGGEEKEREIGNTERACVRARDTLYFIYVFINDGACVPINRSNLLGYPTMPSLDLPPFVLNFDVD